MKTLARILAAVAALLVASPAFAQMDPVARGLATSGVLPKAQIGKAPAQVNEVVTWGDSLTYGYTPFLASLIPGVTVVNNGVPGQSVQQIAVRQGAFPTIVTVSGGSICDAGGDTVTFMTGFEPVTVNGPSGGVTGTVAGKHGTVSFNGSIYTFTCDATGSTAISNSVPFVIDQNYRTAATQIIWVDHNQGNIPQLHNWQLYNLIAANIPPSSQFAFVSNTYDTGQSGNLPSGQFGVIYTQNNDYKLKTFGANHYIDINAPLAASANTSWPVDAADVTAKEPPSSERGIRGCGTLTNAINTSATSIVINIGTTGCTGAVGQILAADSLVIDTGSSSEEVFVTSVTAASGSITAVVQRGAIGAAQSHSAGATVYAIDPIHFYTPCIAQQSWWASTYPTAGTVCGYTTIATAIKNWLVAHPAPAAVAPTAAAANDGQFQFSAGVVPASGQQNALGTLQAPVNGFINQFVIPGVGFCGAFGCEFASTIFDTNKLRISPVTADFVALGSSTNPFGQTWSEVFLSGYSTFSVSGCSATGATGGGSTGVFTSGTTGTCAVTIAIAGGNNNATAKAGWVCQFQDLTTPANTSSWSQTGYDTKHAMGSGTATSGDQIAVMCIGF